MSGPAADVLTPKAMVILQDRPVVAFTKWLADGLRFCSETRRGLQIVTGPGSRITVPLRLVLTSPNSHWVVRADGGYYDGLSGVPLVWDGAGFVPDPRAQAYAPSYTTPPAEPVGAQLTVTFRVRYTSDTAIGTATEEICTALTGGRPAGWGTAEPATDVWRRERLSELFWARGAEATWLTIVGPGQDQGAGPGASTGPGAGLGPSADPGLWPGAGPGPGVGTGGTGPAGAGGTSAVGTLLVSKAGESVEEAVTIVVGYADSRDVPVAALPGLLGGIAAGRHLTSLFTQLNNGRADLTTVPRWLGPPAPIGMAVGGAVSEAPGIPAQRIGDARSPAVWYVLGDGRQQEGWQRYEQLTRHLQSGF